MSRLHKKSHPEFALDDTTKLNNLRQSKFKIKRILSELVRMRRVGKTPKWTIKNLQIDLALIKIGVRKSRMSDPDKRCLKHCELFMKHVLPIMPDISKKKLFLESDFFKSREFSS